MMTALLLLALAAGDWTSLFDGKSLAGWMWTLQDPPFTPSWKADGGVLRTDSGGRRVYLLTRESFTDFELEFEWKAGPGANSGIKYRFQGYWSSDLHQEIVEPKRIEPFGLEYQIADDEQNPDALSDPKHAAAAIYEYMAADKPGPAKANVWHQGRIVARGLHIEHWLDGRKVIDTEIDSPEMASGFAASKRRRYSPLLRKHERRTSPIALQYHDGDVQFRNLRIRKLE